MSALTRSLPACNENALPRMRLCGVRRTPRVEFIPLQIADRQKIISQNRAMTPGSASNKKNGK
jgi:hypothetical protein